MVVVACINQRCGDESDKLSVSGLLLVHGVNPTGHIDTVYDNTVAVQVQERRTVTELRCIRLK